MDRLITKLPSLYEIDEMLNGHVYDLDNYDMFINQECVEAFKDELKKVIGDIYIDSIDFGKLNVMGAYDERLIAKSYLIEKFRVGKSTYINEIAENTVLLRGNGRVIMSPMTFAFLYLHNVIDDIFLEKGEPIRFFGNPVQICEGCELHKELILVKE